jgi:RNA polymerase sigma-70 factor (ECF subfamily)
MDALSLIDAMPPRSAGDAQDRAAVERTLTDANAFDLLYRKYVADIYRYCYRRLGNREAAEDATSHIFMQTYAALPTLGSKPFRPWLFAIARNVLIDRYRRRELLTTSLDLAAEQHDTNPSPEAHALDREGVDAIHELFGMLSERDRQVVELRLAGLTGVEIAHAMQCSHAVVRTAQHRAFVKIRALLERAGLEDTPAPAKGTWQ